LHSIWDTTFIEEDKGNRTEQKLLVDLTAEMWNQYQRVFSNWKDCRSDTTVCPNLWTQESLSLSCLNAYVLEMNDPIKINMTLTRNYYLKNIEVVKVQMFKAAVRMSSFFNTLYPFTQVTTGILSSTSSSSTTTTTTTTTTIPTTMQHTTAQKTTMPKTNFEKTTQKKSQVSEPEFNYYYLIPPIVIFFLIPLVVYGIYRFMKNKSAKKQKYELVVAETEEDSKNEDDNNKEKMVEEF